MSTIIYTSNKSSKKVNKKPGWRQREEEHKAWLLSHGVNPDAPKKKLTGAVSCLEQKPYVRETKHYPSLNSIGGSTAKPAQKVYTGTLIKGIATMHKSNAIPILNQEQAIEVASMRR
jgi:hypothetical protein